MVICNNAQSFHLRNKISLATLSADSVHKEGNSTKDIPLLFSYLEIH